MRQHKNRTLAHGLIKEYARRERKALQALCKVSRLLKQTAPRRAGAVDSSAVFEKSRSTAWFKGRGCADTV